ncbi:MAG: hydrogenase expression/formation protein HypE [Nitrospiraceae bacterium]|nr:MAG: hydrogenase expression/formation protein HypE [Nitrospiraceae bacterium]
MPLIQLSHGSGGRMMHQMIRDYFAPAFDLKTLNDSAVIDNLPKGKIAITTDSYVISPYFFPGGDIGMLAVCGTVNDLSMAGARPLYLTSGFIIEEGFPFEHLKKILDSMQAISREIGVQIIAGDTKVVERGKGDGIFINTAGVGIVEEGVDISPRNIRPGDRIIVSGSIGNHGMSVMAERSGISFEPQILSDVRPLHGLVEHMLRETKKIRVMRDPTRGGLATTLKEFANESGYCMIINEMSLKVMPGVRGACELLGLDPLYVANEGILIAVVDPDVAEILIEKMRVTKTGADAVIIGEVAESPRQTVLLKTAIGGSRIIDMLSGEQLPRIC